MLRAVIERHMRQAGFTTVQESGRTLWRHDAMSVDREFTPALFWLLEHEVPAAPAAPTAPRSTDAPFCGTCGDAMQRAGACFVCTGCGATSGCS